MALAIEERQEIKNMIYEELPCSTNRSCKEVDEVKKLVEKIDARCWMILIAILISIGVQIAVNLLR